MCETFKIVSCHPHTTFNCRPRATERSSALLDDLGVLNSCVIFHILANLTAKFHRQFLWFQLTYSEQLFYLLGDRKLKNIKTFISDSLWAENLQWDSQRNIINLRPCLKRRKPRSSLKTSEGHQGAYKWRKGQLNACFVSEQSC